MRTAIKKIYQAAVANCTEILDVDISFKRRDLFLATVVAGVGEIG
ncbi:MAG: hypothetical protein ACYTA5_06295 [Planctomycetota bacterium]